MAAVRCLLSSPTCTPCAVATLHNGDRRPAVAAGHLPAWWSPVGDRVVGGAGLDPGAVELGRITDPGLAQQGFHRRADNDPIPTDPVAVHRRAGAVRVGDPVGSGESHSGPAQLPS